MSYWVSCNSFQQYTLTKVLGKKTLIFDSFYNNRLPLLKLHIFVGKQAFRNHLLYRNILKGQMKTRKINLY